MIGDGYLVSDYSGNHNDGNIQGGKATWNAEGKINGALSFDDIENTCVLVGNSPTLEQIGKDDSDFSVAFWIYLREGPKGQGIWRTIMRKGSHTTDPNYPDMRTCSLWLFDMSNQIQFNVTTTKHWQEICASQHEIPLNRWTHVCCTKNGNKLRIFIDGSADGAVTTLEGQTINNSDPIYVGKTLYDSELGFNGILDDVQIYSRALSEKEIGEVASGLTILSPMVYSPSDMVERPYPAKDQISRIRAPIQYTIGSFSIMYLLHLRFI